MSKSVNDKDEKNVDDLIVNVKKYGDSNEDILVSLDLSPYTNAFYNKDSAPTTYVKIRQCLVSKFEEISAASVWQEVMGILPEVMGILTEEKKLKIQESPAVNIISTNFGEILKNSADETIQKHHADRTIPPVMEIKVSIITNDEFVYIDICDNGRGYPKSFLDKVQPATQSLISSSRKKYILSYQGKADLKKVDGHASDSNTYDGPELLGGRSLGMRQFLADAQNDKLVGYGIHKKIEHVYRKPDHYQLNFKNSDGSDPKFKGAKIELMTPIAPREAIADLNIKFKQREQDIFKLPSSENTSEDSSSERTTPSLDSDKLFLDLSFNSEKTDYTDEEDKEDEDSFGFSPQKKI